MGIWQQATVISIDGKVAEMSRVLEYYAIVVELTSKVCKNDIPGIDIEKSETLRKHFFIKKHGWILAQALEEILAPFFNATKS